MIIKRLKEFKEAWKAHFSMTARLAEQVWLFEKLAGVDIGYFIELMQAGCKIKIEYPDKERE